MSNPFAGLFQATSKTPSEECLLIEEVFRFTLCKDRGTAKGLIYLEEQAQVFPDRDIDIEILEHALFERLFLEIPDEFLQGSDKHEYSDVITYLYKCYKNTVELRNPVKDSIIAIIMRNVVTALQQPDLYAGQDLLEQFYSLLKDVQESNGNDFLRDVYNKFVSDDGIESLQEPFIALLKLIYTDLNNFTLVAINFGVLELLVTISSFEHLAALLIKHSQPILVDIGKAYADTLLGNLLNISILPKKHNGSYDFFQNPLDQASNNSMENILHTNSDKLSQYTHTIILNLLKSNASVKTLTLNWIGNCLIANTDRGKLWNAQSISASFTTACDGFMINLCYLLVRLCNPFTSMDNQKKILKVDPTYCAVKNEQCEEKGIHMLNMSNETCIVPNNSEENETISEIPTAKSFNFITECFYMAHRAFDLGYKVTIDKLVRLNQDMGRIERAYNEALAQSGPRNEVVENIQQRMTTEITKYLSIKATLSDPILLEMSLHFMSASCLWLSQLSMHSKKELNGSDNFAPLVQKEITFPLPEEIPDTLKCIPEFIIENIVSYLVYIRRFNPKLFEVQGYAFMEPVMTLLIVYMGSPARMKNPHLRARLAEGLESLLPHHKDEPTRLNSLGGYQRERLFAQHPHKAQIVGSLLEVFVGIEMTGQSVQFEQKFNYRRPMYIVMDYLWESEEFQQIFKDLALEAEKNMDAVAPPLFLRFVNLLMNDAVFLLDEALSNMSKLKEMQTKRENGEWDQLSAQERQQNMGYMQQIGMSAKSDNILGKDTIRTLEKLTSKITTVFTHITMVDRVAAMLNYFLFNLVGPNQKNFKVKDQQEYHFDPAATVLDICQIYINLGGNNSFCAAVSQDGRSYRPELFQFAQNVLARIGGGGGSMLAAIQELDQRVAHEAMINKAAEEAQGEAPEEFLDPIMSTVMRDPVTLPSSKQVVDRTTIARHLLSDQTDPFNRSPLTMDQVIPNEELANQIKDWLDSRKSPPPQPVIQLD